MSFFGKNIRKIRSIRKISQTEFAKIFDLSRASVGSYEEGRAEPKLELINNVAKHFSITIDELINKELTVNDLYHFDVGNEPVFKNIGKPKIELKTLPYCQANELVTKSIKELEKSESHINTPLSSNIQSAIAISLDKEYFRVVPSSFNDINTIIINTDKTNINKQQYYLLKANNAIYISKLNILANNRVLLNDLTTELLAFSIEELEYYFPIIQYIGSKPPVSNIERIDQLEKQIQLLIEKTL